MLFKNKSTRIFLTIVCGTVLLNVNLFKILPTSQYVNLILNFACVYSLMFMYTFDKRPYKNLINFVNTKVDCNELSKNILALQRFALRKGHIEFQDYLHNLCKYKELKESLQLVIEHMDKEQVGEFLKIQTKNNEYDFNLGMRFFNHNYVYLVVSAIISGVLQGYSQSSLTYMLLMIGSLTAIANTEAKAYFAKTWTDYFKYMEIVETATIDIHNNVNPRITFEKVKCIVPDEDIEYMSQYDERKTTEVAINRKSKKVANTEN